MISVLVLGSGTSSGVPVIACSCAICESSNQKNKRLRSSILITSNDPSNNTVPTSILIDSGPDFRTQALNFKIPRIDAVFYTHSHADHIFGLDDLRIYNFKQKSEIPIYGEPDTLSALKKCFSYCFKEDPNYEGGGIPNLTLNEIEPFKGLNISTLKITPLRVQHGRLPIVGFKINDFAYLTDCSFVPDETLTYLKDVKVLLISGLRHKEHKTHFTVTQAKEFALKNNIPQTYITHIAHDIEHENTDKELNEETNGKVRLAFDGLRLSV